MRTTITVPDELLTEVKRLTPKQSFSEFARKAIHEKVVRTIRERLAEQMEQGYLHEARNASLDEGWAKSETDGQ